MILHVCTRNEEIFRRSKEGRGWRVNKQEMEEKGS
jgi:hypothetical protein